MLLDERSRPGISAIEADVWMWYATQKMEYARAEELCRELLRRDPPALYREMLASSD